MKLSLAMTPGDRLVIALALLLIAVSFRWWRIPVGDGSPAQAQVWSGRTLLLQAELTDNGHYSVAGKLGTSTVHVGDGGARFSQAPCPDQRCTRTGWLRRPGAAAVCVPNALVLSIASEHDALAY